jgi:hypothetical protein
LRCLARTHGRCNFDGVKPFAFRDSTGRAWHLYDFQTIDGRRSAVPINDPRAEARAFVPVGGGMVLIANFSPVSHHSTEPKLVEGQLHFAKPLFANTAQRMTRE